MQFATPLAWFLLALIPLLGFIYWRSENKRGGGFPTTKPLHLLKQSMTAQFRHLGVLFRLSALVLLVFAIARPQSGRDPGKRSTEALDIMLVVDTSGSMEARDFVIAGRRPNRLEVIKGVMKSFIEDRPDDRLGIVVFGTEAFTQSPLTLDHNVLLQFLDAISIGMAGESTAIGDGLATAVARFKDIDAKSKVVILLTDGSNQAGRVEPLAAARAAQTFGVKVYTVGVGSDGEVPVPSNGRMQTARYELDDKLLQEIADLTGGKYFRAGDTETLVKVYSTIDELEKTKMEVTTFDEREDRYAMFAWPALALLLAELLFGVTRFRRVP